MGLTRGEFLRSLAVGAGSAVVGLSPLGARGAEIGCDGEGGRRVLDDLSQESFRAAVGTSFEILDATSPARLTATLAEVRGLPSTGDAEQFSLLFQGSAEPRLTQQIYTLNSATMGSFDLFLVPVRADEHGISYEAIISRPRRSE
jgi:hypothetical protein